MDAKALSKHLARKIFEVGSEGQERACTRIEFKTGSWKDGTERSLGGFIEQALSQHLEQILIEYSAQETGSAPEGREETNPVLQILDNMAHRIADIATGCHDKEPVELTGEERIALAIIAGCAWERTDTGIRVTDAFGIQKVNGKFIVSAYRPPDKKCCCAPEKIPGLRTPYCPVHR